VKVKNYFAKGCGKNPAPAAQSGTRIKKMIGRIEFSVYYLRYLREKQ
jgi:hypothetical protein